MMFWWGPLCALALDRWIGDPLSSWHPVVLFGKWISWFETQCYPGGRSKRVHRMRGIVLTLTTVLIAGLVPCAIWYSLRWDPLLAWFVNVVLVSTTIAWKGLADAGIKVYRSLTDHGLEPARREVAMIVGRDTEALSEPEVVRATVETMAENIVDAIVSPVFYACIGGAPLALIYRAVNTLDSMVGYRSEKYQYFGWCSARLDDVMNWIPARITIGLLVIAIWLNRRSPAKACRVMRRDAKLHPSPNSGIPESMVAGALGVQLGGTNFYHGVPSHRAHLGDALRPLEPQDIRTAVGIIHSVGWLLVILLAIGGGMTWLL